MERTKDISHTVVAMYVDLFSNPIKFLRLYLYIFNKIKICFASGLSVVCNTMD